LPFDDEDDKEIARQTIQDAADFSFHPWERVSQQAKDVCTALLEKNRHKRVNLERVMSMDWFSEFAAISQARRDASPETRFQAFSLPTTGNEQIQAEIDRVQASTVKEEEKKEWAGRVGSSDWRSGQWWIGRFCY